MHSHMNSYGLFIIAYFIYFIGTISYLLLSTGKVPIPRKFNIVLMIIGVTAHTFGLLYRWHEAGHAPFANMYESVIFLSWVVALAFTLVEIFRPVPGLGAIVLPIAWLVQGYALDMVPVSYIFSLLNALTAGIGGKGGWFPPPTREAEALMPALNSYWLEIHVITIFLAYGAFALSFGTGLLFLWKSHKEDVGKEKNSFPTQNTKNLDALDQNTYWVVTTGFIMLTAGIIFGAVWANETWGSYWSWDPKETWSLITWMVYAAFLHTRLVAKWRGSKTAWLAVAGFVAVLICYYGVNIILPKYTEGGLHSYGQVSQ